MEMNFKLKALTLAAIAAMSMSGTASAITTQNGGELFVLAYDSLNLNTFVATLDSIAPSVSSFTGASDLTMSFATNADWGSFSSAAGFSSANVTYSVLGLDGTTSKLLTTSNAMPAGAVGNNKLLTTLISNFTGGAGSIGPGYLWTNVYNAAVTGNGSAFISATGAGLNGSAATLGPKWETYLNTVTTTAALGVNDNFYQIGLNATSAAPTALLAKSAVLGTWNLSSTGSLNYVSATVAAVPEADTSAMMLVGLGLMGFIARRRRSV
jgi:hypothetical protein